MALFVLFLVIIDLVILVAYTVVEGLRDNLGVKLTTNRELPEEILGVGYYLNNIHKNYQCLIVSDYSRSPQVLLICLQIR